MFIVVFSRSTAVPLVARIVPPAAATWAPLITSVPPLFANRPVPLTLDTLSEVKLVVPVSFVMLTPGWTVEFSTLTLLRNVTLPDEFLTSMAEAPVPPSLVIVVTPLTKTLPAELLTTRPSSCRLLMPSVPKVTTPDGLSPLTKMDAAPAPGNMALVMFMTLSVPMFSITRSCCWFATRLPLYWTFESPPLMTSPFPTEFITLTLVSKELPLALTIWMPSDPAPVTVRLRRVMPPTPFANTPTPLELLIVNPERSVLLARVTDVPVDESSTG